MSFHQRSHSRFAERSASAGDDRTSLTAALSSIILSLSRNSLPPRETEGGRAIAALGTTDPADIRTPPNDFYCSLNCFTDAMNEEESMERRNTLEESEQRENARNESVVARGRPTFTDVGGASGEPNSLQAIQRILNAVFDYMEEVRDEILKRNREEISQANAKLYKDLNKDIVDLVGQVFAQAALRHPISRGLKRQTSKPKLEIADLDKLLEDKNRFVAPLLRNFILITVACFTTKHSELRSWIPEHAYRSLCSYENVLPQVSGFSTIWFSKMKTDSAERFQVDVGKVWTFIIRSTMVSTVMVMRNEYQKSTLSVPNSQVSGMPGARTDAELPLPPSWLSNLTAGAAPGASLADKVHKAVNEEEAGRGASATSSAEGESEASVSAFRTRRKRQKTVSGVEDTDFDNGIVLKKLYSVIRNYLGGTRTPCRILLYSELLFLTEKITNSFRSEAEATAAGYRIAFGKEASAHEGDPGSFEFGEESVWCIKNTTVFSGFNQEKMDSNNLKYQDLQALFPSFHVMLEYPRKVLFSPRDKPDEFPEHNTPGLHWQHMETISLHDIAKKLLLEVVRMKESDELFQSSSYSLKAVHILALAIRGLVKKLLKRPLSNIEESALGACACKRLERDSKLVCPLLGVSGTDKEKENTTKQDQARDRKLTITWTSYKAAKRNRIAELKERAREHAVDSQSMSSNSTTSLTAGSAPVAAFDDSWTYCADIPLPSEV